MATIVRDKIKQPDGKDFKLLDAIDVEYGYTKEDGSSTTSVKERLDDLGSDITSLGDTIASLGDTYYTEAEVDAKFAEIAAIPDSEIIALCNALHSS